MKKKTKNRIMIFTLPILIFLLGNISLYSYCLITPKMDINKAKSYYLYDSEDALVFKTDNDWIPLNKINKNLIDATLTTEDKYFYKHLGFDYIRITKALLTNIISGDKKEGASTISQQYARNLFLNFALLMVYRRLK